MKTLSKQFIHLTLLVALGASIHAAEITGQEKAMAIGAARADAQAQLIASIKGLQVSESSTVNNFVLEEGFKVTGAAGFINGIEFSDPVMVEDMVLIKGTITLNQVVENLNSHSKEYSNGKLESFESVKRFNKQAVLVAQGRGTRKTAGPESAIREDWDGMIDTLKRLKGTGQEKLGATEAARIDGLAQLAQHIKGVKISDQATCFNMALDAKWTEAATSALVRGARVVRYTANGDDLVSCIMQIDLQNVVENIHKNQTLYSDGTAVSYEKIQRFNAGVVTVTATGWGAIGKGRLPGAINGGPTGILGEVK